MKRVFLALTILAALAGCKDEKAEAAALAQQREAAAAPILERYKAAMTGQDWETARVQADTLRFDYAGTKAEAAVLADYDALKAKSDIKREDRRVAALWDYQRNPEKTGEQITAAMYAKEKVDTPDGRSSVLLIFRDHPEWGSSAYVILDRADFDCWKGCQLKVTADEKAYVIPGQRPDTTEAISMFINDQPKLWKLFKDSRIIKIELPIKGSGMHTATFESGGLDPDRMPNWR
ncbi:hypothetical protein G7069_05165 [Lysobacter sp. HDW10]|uniref:lipoprotein n=1 Tax=Lysobacter sp. HDW10 TaxID=2714936 RepID=UPI00140C2BFB|nr:lipoprotein [Lysobacter sp. HDW10]QIK81039.1 hypothetical protein G7069_05165 [Lysobacter sp. HDW10]